TNNPFVLRLSQIIQQQLSLIGIKVNIQNAVWGTFYDNIKNGNFASFILTWVGKFQSYIFDALFDSKNVPPVGAHSGKYINSKMDQILDELLQTIDDEQRRRLATKVQQLQARDMIYLPLWRRHHTLLMRPGLSGCSLVADGSYEGLIDCEWEIERNL